MKRYDYNDDDFQDENLFPDTDYDDDDDDGDYDDEYMDPAEYADMQRRQEALALMQLEMVQVDLNQRLLQQAIKLVKKNTWFFSFRSEETKLRLIAQAYAFLKALVSLPHQGENNA